MTKESRLYRKLPTVPKPIFNVNPTNMTRTDDQISSITINHGTDGPDEGVHPSTCEIQLPEQMIVRTRLPLSVSLTGPASLAIARIVGHESSAIRHRFTGRAGRQEIDDNVIITAKGPQFRKTTTLTASSWSAQLSGSIPYYEFPTQWLIGDMLMRIMKPPYLSGHIPLEVPFATPRTKGPATGRYSDLIDKYASDIGLMMQQTRTGKIRVLTREGRKQDAINRIGIIYPMTRSHAISPTTWSQPNDSSTERMRAKYVGADGVERVLDANAGAPGSAPIKEVDWTHIEFDTPQEQFIKALEARKAVDAYTLPSITVDVLMLMNSPYVHHRYQAGYILALNPGDTLNLSGDWHPNLQGVHFVTGIKENISPDGWTFELNLTPYSHIIGEPSPEIPPRVWESANTTWDFTPGTWNDA